MILNITGKIYIATVLNENCTKCFSSMSKLSIKLANTEG